MSGRIYTFYSWKGGVGRTMALANVGVQLARRGKRVLLVDWDLEAPGLDRYFRPSDRATASQLSLTEASDRSGLLGLLTDAAANKLQNGLEHAWRSRCTQIEVSPLPRSPRGNSAAPSPEPLHLLGSGLGSSDYAMGLQEFSWKSFFMEHHGGEWLEQLRNQWREKYEIVLIDSRTGLTDSGGVCTVQMPDALVLVFTANTQSLEDGLAFLKGVHRTRALFPYERAPLTIVPLLARWEGDREVDLADGWLERMDPVIQPLVETWLPSDLPVRRLLERLRVPHVARFSFGEPLPVLTHSLSDPDRPGLAYELLSELLANGFSGAGGVIEPGYRPVFDASHATDAEVNELVLDDRAREEAFARAVELSGAESLTMIELLLRLGEAGLRVGRIGVADQLAQSAVSKARYRIQGKRDDVNRDKALCTALVLQGDVRRALGNIPDALLAYRESLALMKRLFEADPSNAQWQAALGVSFHKVGDALRDQGDLGGALRIYRESLAVMQRLVEADPSNLTWQRDLSVSYNKVGDTHSSHADLDEALVSHRQSLAVMQRLVQADPANLSWQRDFSVTYSKVGDVLFFQGNLSGALNAYHQTLVMMQRLIEADPSNTKWQRDLSVSHNKIGDVLWEQDDVTGALTAYRQAMAVRQRLVETDPANVEWRRDFAVSQERIGNALKRLGDLDGALRAYYGSLEVSTSLAETDPSNAAWQRDLAVSYNKVGDIRREQGDLDAALSAYRDSLAVSQRLADAAPSNMVWQRDLGVIYSKVGDVLRAQGDGAGALAAYRDMLEVSRHLVDADPSNARWRRGLSVCLTRLAEIHEEQREFAAALLFAQESLSIDEELAALDPTNATWQHDLTESRALVERLRDRT